MDDTKAKFVWLVLATRLCSLSLSLMASAPVRPLTHISSTSFIALLELASRGIIFAPV